MKLLITNKFLIYKEKSFINTSTKQKTGLHAVNSTKHRRLYFLVIFTINSERRKYFHIGF